jgi:CMP-N,N'-diacetyllegionaminic acid synthase
MKNNEIVALIIGRGNNTLKNKNILPVLGRPLLHWGALAAISSKYINRYYISSDCDMILAAAKELNFNLIKRPDELALPNSQSSDAVKHAYEIIKKESKAAIIVVIHANVGTISPKMIDDCIELLMSDNSLSSVIPSHKNDEYHPYRAKKINEDGQLVNFFDFEKIKVSANRQELDSCVFFDHSFWVLDAFKGIESGDLGQLPWRVMGNTIKPYITKGCFDVHKTEDIVETENWLLENDLEAYYKNQGLIK